VPVFSVCLVSFRLTGYIYTYIYIYIYIYTHVYRRGVGGGEEGFNSLEGRYLHTISYAKVQLNEGAADRTKLGKTMND